MSGSFPVQLGDLTSLITKGTTPKTMGLSLSEAGIPFLRAENIRELAVVFGNSPLFIDEQTDEVLSRSRIKRGDVLVSIAGTIGRVGVVPEDAPERMNCNQAVAIVRVNERLDARYLAHWLTSEGALQQIARAKVTATISNLSLGEIAGLIVPLRPLPEQRRIAAVLDKADAIRRKRQEAIALTDELLRSAFLAMFGDSDSNSKGWEVRPFGSIVRDSQLGLVRAAADQSPSRSFPYVRMNAIRPNGDLDLENLVRVNATEAELRATRLRNGDFLFNTRNSRELVGKAAVFHHDETYLFNNNIMRVRFIDGVEPDFVWGFWRTPGAQRELESRKVGTTSVYAIYYKSLATLPVPVPPRQAQIQYAELCRAVRTSQVRQHHARAMSSELFDSLVDRAFSGRL